MIIRVDLLENSLRGFRVPRPVFLLEDIVSGELLPCSF
jgi:hypothetical protein